MLSLFQAKRKKELITALFDSYICIQCLPLLPSGPAVSLSRSTGTALLGLHTEIPGLYSIVALKIPDTHCLVTGGICKSGPILVRRWHFKKTTDGRVIHILYNKGESFLYRITKYVYTLWSVTFHSVFHSVAVKNKLVYDWFFSSPGTAKRDLWSSFSIDYEACW